MSFSSSAWERPRWEGGAPGPSVEAIEVLEVGRVVLEVEEEEEEEEVLGAPAEDGGRAAQRRL